MGKSLSTWGSLASHTHTAEDSLKSSAKGYSCPYSYLIGFGNCLQEENFIFQVCANQRKNRLEKDIDFN